MAIFNSGNSSFQTHNKTLFETVMLADQYGNRVGAANPTGVAVDAFGRARISTPLTLFDSSHRYSDNGLWATSNTSTATYGHNANAGLISLNLDTTANAEVVRETTKVMSYQPGKSLQILNTFVMNEPKANLRQRVGYFGANNGIYLELSGNTLYWVERSYSNNSVSETRVAQSDWNMDTLLGDGPSHITLDITKAQIQFIDVEWLGLGTVRCGFVIDGQLIHTHSFHHANFITSTYMTTGSLPVRYEIKNTDTTSSNSTMKQVCTSVISEGGYELRGAQYAIGTPVTQPRDCTAANTFYPIISIRLNPDKNDGIVILTALSMLGVGNNARFNWQVISRGTVTGASWVNAASTSCVQYDLSGTAVTGGRTLASGFLSATTQASVSLDILKEALFKFQLERDSMANTSYPITLAVSSATAGDDVLATMDWEEISR